MDHGLTAIIRASAELVWSSASSQDDIKQSTDIWNKHQFGQQQDSTICCTTKVLSAV